MKYIHGDLFAVKSGIILHGCNSHGVMGSGVAKTFKELYPEAFEKYKTDIRFWINNEIPVLGNISVYRSLTNHKSSDLILMSGITQKDFGRVTGVQYVDYDAVRSVFQKVFQFNAPYHAPIHIPMLGAGLGGGDWGIISDIIEKEAGYQLDLVTVYQL